ncbi:hypothetical protein PORY_001925 [Pneumocystis oryctolagi]|uniref:Uncharacterized protein n=1 Tax=Pneumocystis oryctolagi TaxID=42067 RepID=A0ACB7C9Y4_9ASCO|nr:hypothetical protein PORY_001925 [Pneumocystis oryctolagi]
MDNEIVRVIHSIPPVTLFLLSGSLFISIAPLLGITRTSQLVNIWPYTFKGQIWRPFTAFFYAGRGLNLFISLFSCIRARYLPFCMLVLLFFMDGFSVVLRDGCGLLSAHLYEFLTNALPSCGGPRLTVPRWFINFFPSNNPRIIKRPFGILFNNHQTTQKDPPRKSAFKGKGYKLE